MATRHVVEPAVAPNVRHRYSCCRHSAADGAEPKERTRRRRRRTTFGRGSDLLLSLLFQDDDGARFPRSAGEEVRGALRSRRADGTEALFRCERSKKALSFFPSPLFLSFLFFFPSLILVSARVFVSGDSCLAVRHQCFGVKRSTAATVPTTCACGSHVRRCFRATQEPRLRDDSHFRFPLDFLGGGRTRGGLPLSTRLDHLVPLPGGKHSGGTPEAEGTGRRHLAVYLFLVKRRNSAYS